MVQRLHTDRIENFIAEAAVTANRVVVHGTDANHVKMPAGDNGPIVGVAVEAQATAGGPVQVQTSGIAKCIAHAAITKGLIVGAVTTTGRVQQLTAGVTTTVVAVGRALETVTTQGDEVAIDLDERGYAATT